MTGFNLDVTVVREGGENVSFKNVSAIAGYCSENTSHIVYSKKKKYDFTLGLRNDGVCSGVLYEVCDDGDYQCISISKFADIREWVVNARPDGDDGIEMNYTFKYFEEEYSWYLFSKEVENN